MPGALMAAPFIAMALVLVTLPHHWRVKNIATLSIIAWLSLYNLTFGVNAIIWDGNTRITAPVWCDIATKLRIGADMGLPGCCLCMAKRLNRIAYGLEMSPRGWRHRALDIMLCWGFPVIVMALHTIVQGHRFDIIQDFGCIPAIYISWPSVIILDASSFIPAALALVYCALALWKLYRRRVAFRIVLNTSTTSLTPSRYIRLMIMSFVLGSWNVILISISTSNEYIGTESGLQPWTSWVDVHAGFSFIGQYTPSEISAVNLRCMYILWWAVPISSVSFFAFFGIGAEAMKDYQATLHRVLFRRHPGKKFVESMNPHWQENLVSYSTKPLPPLPMEV